MGDTLRSSGRLSLAVAASRVLGLARDAIFASLFGSGIVADAYHVAYRIPNLLRDLFAEGALSSAFVPTFTSTLVSGDRQAAHRLGNLVVAGVLVSTGTIVALGVIFAEQLVDAIAAGFVGSGDAASKLELATLLTRILLPMLSLVSLSAVWMGMLNAQRKFMVPAFAPAVFNLASLAVGLSLLAAGMSIERAILAWSAGTVGAGVCQAGFQLPLLWRLGYRPWPRLRGIGSHPGVRRILTLMGPAIFGLAAVQINLFVNTRFAGQLGDGPLSQLSYAFRLFYLPVGLFSVALATVTTTRVSEDAARNDRAALLNSTAEGTRAVWMLMMGSAVGLFVLADPIIEIVYERGAFGRVETLATAAVLRGYAVALVPYGLVKILAPVFYGLERPRIPLWGSLAAVAVNLTFNALTYRQLGAPGLALGTGLGAMANYAVLRVGLRRVVGPLPGRWRHAGALLLSNAALGAAAWGWWYGVVEPVLASDQVPRSVVVPVGLAVIVAGGFWAYTAGLSWLSYPDAKVLATLPGRMWAKLTGRPR
ncbi:MAG: murein biosynthesis integral membrane protein MurJ [Myxococcales bacterium FL481]|nr:MAG: murein biosynthesis integral membrane protein MurJ [Myxococcales bacterium FL481]